MRTEPLVTVATITALATAVLALLLAFGVPVTYDQHAAIMAVVAVLGPLVVALIGRLFVTPVRGRHAADD